MNHCLRSALSLAAGRSIMYEVPWRCYIFGKMLQLSIALLRSLITFGYICHSRYDIELDISLDPLRLSLRRVFTENELHNHAPDDEEFDDEEFDYVHINGLAFGVPENKVILPFVALAFARLNACCLVSGCRSTRYIQTLSLVNQRM